MSKLSDHFEGWIRTEFVALNDALEAQYEQLQNTQATDKVGLHEKRTLVEQGSEYCVALLKEGNTGDGFDNAFQLLGDVGMLLAACQRHGIEAVDHLARSLAPVEALALHIGATIGMAPRFSTAHLTTHNPANFGQYKCFTSHSAEQVFLEGNTLSIFAFQRAADELYRVSELGVTHPLAPHLLRQAKAALQAVIQHNAMLAKQLDVSAFFNLVRPYYKPFKVGKQVYRGANAGDFAGINILDLLLGVCSANDSEYAQQLVDKFLFMRPEEQNKLKRCMRTPSLLDNYLSLLESQEQSSPFTESLMGFLAVAKVFGETAIQHHNLLVNKFITCPASALSEHEKINLTASGPPLDELLMALAILRDKRAVRPSNQVHTRYEDFERLRQYIKGSDHEI